MTNQTILDKYHHIIAEEVNVKEVRLLPETMHVTKTYVPLGKELSEAFGKDTGHIISAAKQGHVEELADGDIKVLNDGQERILTSTQYEIRYSGLAGDNQIVEDGVIVELGLTITPELKAEGIAREISRFLNQMRKDADYTVSDRVACYRSSTCDELKSVLSIFAGFLKTEALLSDITQEQQTGDITSIFELDGNNITFTLKR